MHMVRGGGVCGGRGGHTHAHGAGGLPSPAPQSAQSPSFVTARPCLLLPTLLCLPPPASSCPPPWQVQLVEDSDSDTEADRGQQVDLGGDAGGCSRLTWLRRPALCVCVCARVHVCVHACLCISVSVCVCAHVCACVILLRVCVVQLSVRARVTSLPCISCQTLNWGAGGMQECGTVKTCRVGPGLFRSLLCLIVINQIITLVL